MGEGLKDFLLHKISLRIIYIVAAYSTSHVISLAAGPDFQTLLSKAGVTFLINDPALFKTWVTGTLLVGGEFIFHFVHTKFILPQVNPKPPEPPKPGYGTPA